MCIHVLSQAACLYTCADVHMHGLIGLMFILVRAPFSVRLAVRHLLLYVWNLVKLRVILFVLYEISWNCELFFLFLMDESCEIVLWYQYNIQCQCTGFMHIMYRVWNGRSKWWIHLVNSVLFFKNTVSRSIRLNSTVWLEQSTFWTLSGTLSELWESSLASSTQSSIRLCV